MGFLSKILSSTKSGNKAEFIPETEQEAWAAILFSIIAADGEIRYSEVDVTCDILSKKSFFKHYDITDLYHLISEIHKKIGGKELIEKSCPAISKENRLTVLALAADLVMADGQKSSEEEDLSHYLADQLGIDKEEAKKVFEVMSWKNKYNRIAN